MFARPRFSRRIVAVAHAAMLGVAALAEPSVAGAQATTSPAIDSAPGIASASRRLRVELLPSRTALEHTAVADPKPTAMATLLASGSGAFGRGALWMATAGGLLTIARLAPEDESWQVGFGVRGGVASVLDLATRSRELLTSDFYVAFPVTLHRGAWGITVAPWHESSHLGDEYSERTGVKSRAVSHDQVVVRLTREGPRGRLYAGAHALTYHWVRQPTNVSGDRALIGAELRGRGVRRMGIVLRPVVAIDDQHLRGWDWARSTTLVAGVELARDTDEQSSPAPAVAGLAAQASAQPSARLRLFISAHDGAAPWWQFGEQRMRWIGAGVQWEP